MTFGGSQSESAIAALEAALSIKLRGGYREFLSRYGAGGAVPPGISGIWPGNATMPNQGSCYGDTVRLRESLSLPPHLVVVYRDEDTNATLCLDLNDRHAEPPVVAVDASSPLQARQVAPSFEAFLVEYLALRSESETDS